MVGRMGRSEGRGETMKRDPGFLLLLGDVGNNFTVAHFVVKL